MAHQWAIDLGTTNSVVAMAEEGSVRALHLPEVGRVLPTEQYPLIPSAIHITETQKRFMYFFRRRVREVYIGQQALSRNYDGRSPAFASSFKRYLGSQSHRTMIRANGKEISVREVTRLFLERLLGMIHTHTGEKVADLTIPAPVGYFEHYRAELQALCSSLGIKRFRSLDEPVAAALGYGVNVAREERLLVVDFGGGTLNLAVVGLGHQAAETGAAPVLAKHMVGLGGDDVDRWIIEHIIPKELLDLPEWQRDLKWEAMLVKERASEAGSAEFHWGGFRRNVSRSDLVEVLRERKLYHQLNVALNDIRTQLQAELGSADAKVDEVLITGGSSLLPEVPAVVDAAFPEAVVRHDRDDVFTAVAIGSARYAGGVSVTDFVYHDYALAVQNEKTHTVEYELLVPRRTRYPTPPDFIVRYYADYPGMEQMSLRICEVGRLGQAPVAWETRPNGNRYWTAKTDEERALVVELNPADAPLLLRPAGEGTSPRLRVTYSINADRWLCITAEDLVSKRILRDQDAVVRLR